MNTRSAIFMTFSSLLLATIGMSQGTAPVNYLNVNGPIVFNSGTYEFVWSAHPSPVYYKHEYLKKGETVQKFNSMVMVEVLTGTATPKDLVANKVAELKTMQSTNPYVQFETFFNKDSQEYILDFLVTANSADNKVINIAERNVYRYKVYSENGKKGVLLFAVSTRSYGDNVTKFLQSMKGTRMDLINKVKAFAIPAFAVK